jgi:hypothetical protein
MLKQRLNRKPNLLSASSTSKNKLMISCRKPMPSTSSATINIRWHTNFRWDIRFGFICRKSASEDPIGSYTHSDTGLTPSPRLWVRMILNQVFLLSFSCTWYLMLNCSKHIFHLSSTLWIRPSSWPLQKSILPASNMRQLIILLTPRQRIPTKRLSNSIGSSKEGIFFIKASGSPGFRFNKSFLI